MKKIRFLIIYSMCLFIFSFVLTGCVSNKFKIDIIKNQPSENSETNVTSTSGIPQAPNNVKQTEKSDSQSKGYKEITDYSQYLKKIWIIDSENYVQYDHSSFFITKIEHGELEGRFSASSVAWPDFFFYRLSPSKHLGDLTGIVNNGIAECQFTDKVGNKGKFTLTFKENDEIEATIEYTNKGDAYKDEYLDGKYLFRPYNLTDDKEFTILKEYSFAVELNSWGKVNFVSGEVNTGNEMFPAASLTNEKGDILYNFSASFQTGSRIIEASINDINKDGLKDVVIVTAFNDPDIDHIKWVFYQMDNGLFYSSHLETD